MTRRAPALAALLLVLQFPGVAPAEGEIPTALAAGQHRFERDCGICHGLDGRGAGAFTEILNVVPPDLTVLARRNNGYFPFSLVYNTIDGRNTPLAHGRKNMPIWGDRYKQAVTDGSETLVRGRILELILYVQSLQVY